MKLGEIMVFYAVLDFSHGDNHQEKIASQLICQLININMKTVCSWVRCIGLWSTIFILSHFFIELFPGNIKLKRWSI